MPEEVKIPQEDLLRLIKLAVSEHPINILKFVTTTLESVLPEVKDQLGLDFGYSYVHPDPHPRESASIELYKGKQVVLRLNEKTCMSGCLDTTIKKLKDSIRPRESGLIVAFVIFEKGDSSDSKMILILIPEKVITSVSVDEIERHILDLLKKKADEEGYTSYHLIALNEAILLSETFMIIKAVESLEKTIEYLSELKNHLKEINEKLRETEKSLMEAKEYLKEAGEKL